MTNDDGFMKGLRRLCQCYHVLTKPNAIRLSVHLYDEDDAHWEYGPVSGRFAHSDTPLWMNHSLPMRPKGVSRIEFRIHARHPESNMLYGYNMAVDPMIVAMHDEGDYFEYMAMASVRKLVLNMYGL